MSLILHSSLDLLSSLVQSYPVWSLAGPGLFTAKPAGFHKLLGVFSHSLTSCLLHSPWSCKGRTISLCNLPLVTFCPNPHLLPSLKDKQVWNQGNLGLGPALNFMGSVMSRVENTLHDLCLGWDNFHGLFLPFWTMGWLCNSQAISRAMLTSRYEVIYNY